MIMGIYCQIPNFYTFCSRILRWNETF